MHYCSARPRHTRQNFPTCEEQWGSESNSSLIQFALIDRSFLFPDAAVAPKHMRANARFSKIVLTARS